jgi:tripeptidyl-peptidase-1
MLFGSGEDGVGKHPNCYTNDGKNRPSFLPQFPASCPYVTTVGATQGIAPEVAAYNPKTGFASGGGKDHWGANTSYSGRLPE